MACLNSILHLPNQCYQLCHQYWQNKTVRIWKKNGIHTMRWYYNLDHTFSQYHLAISLAFLYILFDALGFHSDVFMANLPFSFWLAEYIIIASPLFETGSQENDTQKLHTTEMRMLRWARGKTKKEHIKNEDIWREANIEPMTTYNGKRWLIMARPCVKEGRKEGEYTTKKMVTMQV